MTQTGTQPHRQSRAPQQPTAPSKSASGAVTGGPDGSKTGQAASDRSDIEFGHSPFDANGPRDEPPAQHTGQAGPTERSGTDRADRAGRRVDGIDAQLGDQSLQLNADVDRLVDVLYRKLERKRRVERQRRGF